jgi:acyl carrier protein
LAAKTFFLAVAFDSIFKQSRMRHFADDLGADWLDRLELMIAIEDRFVDVVIRDEDVDQIEVVGDLIRHIENVNNDRRGPSIVEASLQ